MKLKKSAVKAALKPTDNAPESPETVIDVKLDIGFGNTLFLRGQGAGLNWERGVPLVCVDGKTWRWSQKLKDTITFKVLINDKVWAAGGDLTAKPGQKLELAPAFA
jgi:hypothetical protein